MVSWTRTLEAIVPMSHKHQPTQGVWIFHRVVPSLVLKTVGIMCRVRRAVEAFEDPDRALLSLLSQGFSIGVISF
jgi:hypothetical protein